MTILKCSATKCIYNDNKLCSAVISRSPVTTHTVQMKQAVEVSATVRTAACKTAVPIHCGCEKINIDCKAQECTYNNNVNVPPPAIDVAGCSTDGCNETKCSTFACKC